MQPNPSELSVSLLIPTLNAGDNWLLVLESITRQSIPFKNKIVIDSGSKDKTVALAESFGFEVIKIDKSEFNHGKTRQKLVELAGDIDVCVFLTQDAILASDQSVENLVKPFGNDERLGLAYGRQLPHKNAETLEAHARLFNYPATSQLRTLQDRAELGFKTIFCSNSFAAYRRGIFDAIGGFPSDSIMGEDSIVAAKMLSAGFEVAYVAEATVYHSHTYTIKEEFKRYFDTGVFHDQNRWLFVDYGKPSGEGFKFVQSELKYVFRNDVKSVFKSVFSTAAKWLGYKCGINYRHFPASLVKKMSMHSYYWSKSPKAPLIHSFETQNLKVALVQDWLTVIGGSENVFKEIASLFPGADIFTLVARKETIKDLGLENHRVTTSFVQKLPFAKTKYRAYLPLFPLAIEQFDLSGYDLIISSSHAVAKGVLSNADQVHVCYCHCPMRYAWDLHHQYLAESGLDKGIKGLFVKYILHRIRQWDVISTNRVDHFIANSHHISKRIKKVYNRESTVIYPNVATRLFTPGNKKEDYYVTCSRFVPYKKIDLIVDAFSEMPDKKLIVIGDGPDFKKVKKRAGSNVTLLGFQPFEILKDFLSSARAFVFAAEEDFGILPVEAQSCGTPVIAYNKGGLTESVIKDVTGIFFNDQTIDSLKQAINYFESIESTFDSEIIVRNAARFSTERFKNELLDFVIAIMPAKETAFKHEAALEAEKSELVPKHYDRILSDSH